MKAPPLHGKPWIASRSAPWFPNLQISLMLPKEIPIVLPDSNHLGHQKEHSAESCTDPGKHLYAR